jgi:hypothetical protein
MRRVPPPSALHGTTASPRIGAVAVPALLLAAALLVPTPAAASDYASDPAFGLGVVLGEPTGITLKGILGAGHAVQASFAFALVYRDRFLAALDYVWHPTLVTANAALDLAWHFGLGGVLGVWYDEWAYDCIDDDGSPLTPAVCRESARLMGGLRVPIGLDLMFTGAPVELFLELAPEVELYPVIDWLLYGGFGARYYFG